MNMKDAWNSIKHGENITNPKTGTVIGKWIGEKPELPSGFDRFIEGNISNINTDDLVSSDWIKKED